MTDSQAPATHNPTPPVSPEVGAVAGRPRWRPQPATVLGALGLAAVFFGAYAANLANLAHTWFTDPDYSHGILVLPVALVLLWRLWPGLDAPAMRPTPWGLAWLAPILAARAFLYARGEYWLETATLVPAAAALLLTGVGWPTLRRTWPAVAFLVFMLTIPGSYDARLSLPLQGLAARVSCSLLRLMGYWVINQGNVIVLGSEQLEVARACSGLAMLVSLAATVTATSLLISMERWKRVMLLASIVPIALLCNTIRIVATAWAYQTFGGEVGRRFAHDLAGWLMMPLAMVLVGLELAWMSRLVTEVPGEPPAPEPPSRRPSPQLVTISAQALDRKGRGR